MLYRDGRVLLTTTILSAPPFFAKTCRRSETNHPAIADGLNLSLDD